MNPNNKSLNRNIVLLMAATFAVSMAMAMNGALYNNFLKVLLNGDYMKMGAVKSIRETPGIMSAFINGLASALPETVFAALSLVVMAIGMAGYYWTSTAGMLMIMSFIWSIGFHLWGPLSGSLGISLTSSENRGEIFGKIASIGAIGTFAGYLVIALLARLLRADMQLLYRWMYLAAGLIILFAGAAVWKLKVNKPAMLKPRFIFRKHYTLYYILQFLEGCRKQVFVTFATFTLVLNYRTGPETMAILLFVNYFFAFLVSPIFGRWIDHFGEKKVLTWNYFILILVYLCYATLHNQYVLYTLFCADNILFTFSLALTTYIGKIAPKEEVTGTLAMGVSMNHIAAVIVPIVGFIIWKKLGYEICFVAGSLVVLMQLIAVQRMRTPEHH